MHPDYGTIVLCAVRYCFGRQTYTPSLVIGYVKHNWNDISERDKAIIHRDVKEELAHEDKTSGWLGHPYDVQTWRDFLWWMDERMRLDKEVA